MITRAIPAALVAAVTFAALSAIAKLPPPPPPTDAQKQAAEEKKAKAAQDAEKAKAELATAEELTVKNFQSNMKQQGKPVPRPVPVAAASTPPTGGKPGPENNTAKPATQGQKANTPNAASGGAK
jgi:hypothetical protein